MSCSLRRVEGEQNNGISTEAAIIGSLVRTQQQDIYLAFRMGQDAGWGRHLNIRPDDRAGIVCPGAADLRRHLEPGLGRQGRSRRDGRWGNR